MAVRATGAPSSGQGANHST